MKYFNLEIEQAVHTFYSKSTDAIVVVPCYNEEERLDTDAFVDFALRNPGIRFLFVDDGSKDDTLSVLYAMQTRAPHVLDVLAMPQNGGKAEAVRQGLIFATKQGVDTVGYFDADLATPLQGIIDLTRVLQNLSEIEVVFGSRRGGLGHRIAREPMRRVVSYVCGRLARLATGLPLIDTQCGAKMFRNTNALRTAITRPFEADWLFDVELALRLIGCSREMKRRVYELPLMEWNEIPGSNIKPTDIVRSGIIMLKLIAQRWTIRHEFRRRSDQLAMQAESKATLYSTLDLQDVVHLRERYRNGEDFFQIDLTQVQTVGPSVFSAMIGLCDDMRAEGQHVIVMLPDDDEICNAAQRSGLIAIHDCRRIVKPQPLRANNVSAHHQSGASK